MVYYDIGFCIVVPDSTIFNTCYVHYIINTFTNYTLMRNKNHSVQLWFKYILTVIILLVQVFLSI